MDLIVKKNNGDEFVYSNTSMIGVKPESNVMVLVRNNDQYTLHLDEIEEYYFEDRKPRVLYIVVDEKKIDRYDLPTFVTFGYDLDELQSVYHGNNYRIFELGEL